MVKGTDRLYLFSILMLMFVLPIVSFLVEIVTARQAPDLWNLIGRWFVFWAVGVRFVTAAVRQIVNPCFTAEEIFRISAKESNAVVRELGLANLCMGLVGMLSFVVPAWCTGAALGGGLYLAFAGIQHIIKKPAGPNEIITMFSDMFVFLVLAAYMFHAI
jgi:hypothetical protein